MEQAEALCFRKSEKKCKFVKEKGLSKPFSYVILSKLVKKHAGGTGKGAWIEYEPVFHGEETRGRTTKWRKET